MSEQKRVPKIASNKWQRARAVTAFVLKPLLFLAAGLLLIMALATAQRYGWISASGPGGGQVATAEHADHDEGDTRYICPMMCTPPLSEPGRCPVCGMELVPLKEEVGKSGATSVAIDPAARRVANIRTTAAEAVALRRSIRAVGRVKYDEAAMKTLAAYVDGRLEKLYADYTGVVVNQGDRLALLYSPQLYSAQAELLAARRLDGHRRSGTTSNATYGGGDLSKSAHKRLREFGMTAEQIQRLEQSGEAASRLPLVAPIHGTVIEKLAVEGQYVKTGQPIYRLADLSSVWLMLEMFPEEAAMIRYGQKVDGEVQSLPGRKISGRVAFIDPTVDPKTRTVGVRVVLPNDDGLLRVGDYATATVDVRLDGTGSSPEQVYDPQLAGKWISPRHPQVVEDSPGKCRLCGVDLVPASRFGFAAEPIDRRPTVTVPRSAVLMAGDASVVYVETEPGRFELRRVVLGPSDGDRIAILEGVQEGEQVATSGNFLIDSQMQLAGKPSLIDPTKAKPSDKSDEPGLAPPQATEKGSGPDASKMDLPPIGKPRLLEPEEDAP